MPNEENLIPFDKRTESERREISQKAGVESGKKRRRKKTMKDTMRMILDLTPTTPNFNKLSELGVDGEDEYTNQTVMLAALFQEAASGNVKAVREIRSILGEQLETPLEAKERRARTKKLDAETEQLKKVETDQSEQVVIVDDI